MGDVLSQDEMAPEEALPQVPRGVVSTTEATSVSGFEFKHVLAYADARPILKTAGLEPHYCRNEATTYAVAAAADKYNY